MIFLWVLAAMLACTMANTSNGNSAAPTNRNIDEASDVEELARVPKVRIVRKGFASDRRIREGYAHARFRVRRA